MSSDSFISVFFVQPKADLPVSRGQFVSSQRKYRAQASLLPVPVEIGAWDRYLQPGAWDSS